MNSSTRSSRNDFRRLLRTMITAVALPAGPATPDLACLPAPPSRSPVELVPGIQHYDWGHPDVLPRLVGDPNPERLPWAELWMGAHPDAPATVLAAGGPVPLDAFIESDPEAILHPAVAAHYERRLPFLFKVLSVAAPLSLQAHPDGRTAAEGFARELEAGVGEHARNHRDPRHKPELVAAVTEFHGLCGFQPLEEIRRRLAAAPELTSLAEELVTGPGSLEAFYSRLMTLPQPEVNRLLDPLIDRLRSRNAASPFQKYDPEYWLLRADRIHSRNGNRDRGLFAFYLLNLVHLQPGEATFVGAGVLHAYLEGTGVEVMASSNNVVRGGLTTKRVDVAELLRIVRFETGKPAIIRGTRVQGTRQWVYDTPAEEFELCRIELDAESVHVSAGEHAIEILIVMDQVGSEPLTLRSAGGVWRPMRGKAYVIPANCPFQLTAAAPATVFRATVPLDRHRAETASDVEFRGRRPASLTFGTSGLRGLVGDITDLEAYVNTCGFLEYLRGIGELDSGTPVCLAGDLRPSTDGPSGSILRAVARAIEDSGCRVDHLGRIPTPALTWFALQNRRPSVMVTGSHIPFDRNGIKFNKPAGEVLKPDERGILACVRRVREREYLRDAASSPFGDDGMFKPGQRRPLPEADPAARREYLRRYLEFFPPDCLHGRCVVLYQHSGVGRDLIAELLQMLGARVIPMARSDTFVPVDTEAIADADLAFLQKLADIARTEIGSVDAVVSTDGDSDRPLVAPVNPQGRLQFIGGDLLGLIAAEYLEADAAVVPVSATDAIDAWAQATGVAVRRTRIGSPHVIEGMQRARAEGFRRVVGWEANGGFLAGSDIELSGRILKALPTRDAPLPILGILASARLRNTSVAGLFRGLPSRFSRAGLLDGIAPERSLELMQALSPPADLEEVWFGDGSFRIRGREGDPRPASPAEAAGLTALRSAAESQFGSPLGCGRLTRLNLVDGVRMLFEDGDVVHLRPSGNAPQLRVYTTASSAERASRLLHSATQLVSRMVEDGRARLTALPAPGAQRRDFVKGVRRNIRLASELTARGESPEIIGTVSGSSTACEFWGRMLRSALPSFHSRLALSLHEDLPTNQAFGILLLWQRLRPHLQDDRGALMAFVFGDGTRSTPLTEAENAQKPAIATFVRDPGQPSEPRFLPIVELALRNFVPVQQFLRRSGFRGIVVKWGDEVQIPTRNLEGADVLFEGADVVRFVSMREIDADSAMNKDWVGVDPAGRVTAFIPRRPLGEMEALADSGRILRRDGRLHGGVNLGSIALSHDLLDALLEEFAADVNDPAADRRHRPALDPEFFTALTIAAIHGETSRRLSWERALAESTAVAEMHRRHPNLLMRLRQAISRMEHRRGRPLRMVAMDFGDQYWGDMGQHNRIFEFYLALNDSGPEGEVARALAGIPSRRDADENIIVDSTISSGITVRNSVLINAQLTGTGMVRDAVLIGTRAGHVRIRGGFDVLSKAASLQVDPRGGTYKVVSPGFVHAARGERLTTLFLPSLGPALFRVHESVDLRDRAATYDVPICGNPCSFREAHECLSAMTVEELSCRRSRAEDAVGLPGL